jgi:ABC-type multidrug transport system fused ATPase/permease subunit
MNFIDKITASLAPSPDPDKLVAAAPTVPLRQVFARFWPLARPYRKVFVGGLVLAALLPLVEAAEIWLFKVVVDDVLVSGSITPLAYLIPIMVALALVGALLSFGDEYASTWVGERLTLKLRTKLLSHLQRLEPDTLDRRRHGDVLARLTGDVHAIETLVLSALGEVVQAASRLLFFAGALWLLSWKLALAAVIVVPVFYLAAKRFARLSRRAARERRRRSGSLSAAAEETLANTALVQTANAQDLELGRFERESEGKIAAELAGVRISGLFAPVIDLIEVAGGVIIIYLGTLAVASGELSIGGLLAFLAYLGQLYRPVRDLSRLGQTVFEASAGADRVIELLEIQPQVQEAPHARPLDRGSGILEFENVSYRYPGSDRPAVEDFSMSVRPGALVAVVGPSGAGKSTLAKLAVRFVDPDAGSVRLDGQDLREVTLHSLRDNVTVLLQDAPLFDGTVSANVAYGRPNATEAEVRQALDAASGSGLADELSDGTATRVGQRGRALSGGQRRRVALARALLQDAPVLVLDEPSSGLDTAAARRLLPVLRRVIKDRGTLLITHDLVLAAAADEVILLEEGRIVAQGTPEMLAGAGTWARLRDEMRTHEPV